MFTRRDFLKIAIRNSALAGIAIGSGYLIFKDHTDEACKLDFTCNSCNKLNKCKLPEAENHKKSVNENFRQQ